MAKKREGDFPDASVKDLTNEYGTENVLSGLALGVAVYKISEKEWTPLFVSESFKNLFRTPSGGRLSDIRTLLPGRMFLDPGELRREIFAGNTVEFMTRLRREDGSCFIGRAVISPSDAENRIFNVALFNAESSLLISGEPDIKTPLPGKRKNSTANELVHGWHDRRYRLLLEDKSVFTFEYDSESDLYTYYAADNDGGISAIAIKNYIKNLKLHKKTKLDPHIVISQNIEEVLTIPSTREFDVHDYNEETGYRWYSCKCKSIADADGRVRRVVGWFNDITSKQQEYAMLTDLAEKDGLTGVLNRAAMERYFVKYFAGSAKERSGMLFFIDFDKFKYINDTYGHLAGDEVLRESAKAIHKVLRQGDVLFRYGGDEFIVFINRLSDVDAAEKRAKQIIDAVGGIIIRGEIKPKCSVGFTEIWDTDKTSHDAVKRADTALLHAKKVAAGSYVYYGKRGLGSAMVVKRVDKDKTVIIEKESLHDNDFFAEMFYLLFSAKSESEGLDKLLEHVGKRFNISRAHIFEILGDGCARNTHEWCKKGIKPSINMLQHVNGSVNGKRFDDRFNSSGIFYCNISSEPDADLRALLELHGIKSMLIYLIVNNGKPVAMLGYDDCENSCVWSQEQIDGLVFVSKLAEIFISKNILQKTSFTKKQKRQ